MLILGVKRSFAHGEEIDKSLRLPMRSLTSCFVSARGALTQFTPVKQAKSAAYLWIERNRGAVLRAWASDEIHSCHDSNTDHAHARRGGG